MTDRTEIVGETDGHLALLTIERPEALRARNHTQ